LSLAMEQKESTLTLSEQQSNPVITNEDDIGDRKLLRKLDWHILPPLSLLYLLCYLDRT
jgi:hypothetical protein